MSDVAVDQQKSTYFDRANLDVEGAPPLVKSRPLLRRRAPARRFPSGPRVAARVPQGMSNFYCHPGKAGGSPLDFSAGRFSILGPIWVLRLRGKLTRHTLEISDYLDVSVAW